MYTLERANTYINNNKNKIREKYRQKYHAMGPIGWINDPNGFIYYDGEYHLFYQYYPYKGEWGPMHWGHSKSKDLINWEEVSVALAPDQPYDKDGCFSGTAIEKDGKLYLMYTGHINGKTDDDIRQVQCIAVSEDGVNFKKIDQNPVIDEYKLPKNAAPQDFRDPKVIKRGDNYYSLIASKAEDGGGQILLYKSPDLLSWEFVSVMLKGKSDEGAMWECPDIFNLDGKDVLILSVEGKPQKGVNFSNTHSVVSVIGKMDWDNGVFIKEEVEELDYGLDFYAPQSILDNQGRRIMISWMQMWGRSIPTANEPYGWAGAMTLPRELSIKNNHIYQRPIQEIEQYFTNKKSLENIRLIDEKKVFDELFSEVYALEMEINIEKGQHFEVEVCSNHNERTVLSYDCKTNLLELDRENSGVVITGEGTGEVNKRSLYCKPENSVIKLEIFVDRSSLEVFVNGGKHTITSTIYPTNQAEKIAVFAEGEIEISYMDRWEIEV